MGLTTSIERYVQNYIVNELVQMKPAINSIHTEQYTLAKLLWYQCDQKYNFAFDDSQ